MAMYTRSVLSVMLLAALVPCVCHAATGEPSATATVHAGKLIVIGFMGGKVHAGNMVHREALDG